jgi:hypothetical protein
MKRPYTMLFMLCLFLLLSCKKTDKERETQSISDGMEQLKLNERTNWLVILPGMGCTGCIQEGEAFVKENITNPRIFFVVTKLQSLKILQQKIGRKIEGLPNVFIDTKNSFTVPTSNGIYPCIVHLKNGKIMDHEFQSPRNGQAFEQLKLKTTL